jgi:hypothetical protein
LDRSFPVNALGNATAKFDPGSGRLYHGVGGDAPEIVAYDTAMLDTTRPLIVKLYYSLPGSAPAFSQLRAGLAALKSVGRFPELSLELTDGVIATDSIIATTAQLDSTIDSIASICKEFGGRIFIRPGFEFNGSWNGYTPYLYVNAFKKIVNRFRARGAADSAAFIWCYYPGASPNDFDAADARGSRWYPGDDYVDWFGVDLFDSYDFDMTQPEDDANGITARGRTERFLQMARDKGKPVIVSEASAAGVNITADTLDGIDDWDSWFAPFWDFLTAHDEVRAFCYDNHDWGGTWGNARIDGNIYIVEMYTDEMSNPWYIHLPTSIVTPPPLPLAPLLASPATTSTLTDLNATLVWHATAPGVDRYWLEIATDAAFTQSSIDSTLADTSAARSGFQNGRTYWWRVRGHNESGWGAFSDVWNFTVNIESSVNNPATGVTMRLAGNLPDPFSASTVINFSLARHEHATIALFDPMGRRVRTLVDEELSAGEHALPFNAADLAAGVYFYTLETPSGTLRGAMHLVR